MNHFAYMDGDERLPDLPSRLSSDLMDIGGMRHSVQEGHGFGLDLVALLEVKLRID